MAMGSGAVANVQSEPGLSSLSGGEARRASALPSEADIQLILVKGSANDPKRTFQTAQKKTRLS